MTARARRRFEQASRACARSWRKAWISHSPAAAKMIVTMGYILSKRPGRTLLLTMSVDRVDRERCVARPNSAAAHWRAPHPSRLDHRTIDHDLSYDALIADRLGLRGSIQWPGGECRRCQQRRRSERCNSEFLEHLRLLPVCTFVRRPAQGRPHVETRHHMGFEPKSFALTEVGSAISSRCPRNSGLPGTRWSAPVVVGYD